MNVCLYPRLHFLDGDILCISYDEPTHEVFGGIYAYLVWSGVYLYSNGSAHRSSSHLERAQQILCLKHTYHYDNLVRNQVLGLVTHIVWKQLKRYNYPTRPDEPNDIDIAASRHMPCSVAYTIANTLDADQLAKILI